MSITLDDDKCFTVTIPVGETNHDIEFEFTEKGLEQGTDCVPWSFIRIARMYIDGPKMEGEARQFTFNIAGGKEPSVELIQLISQCISHYKGLEEDGSIIAVLAYFNQLYGVK